MLFIWSHWIILLDSMSWFYWPDCRLYFGGKTQTSSAQPCPPDLDKTMYSDGYGVINLFSLIRKLLPGLSCDSKSLVWSAKCFLLSKFSGAELIKNHAWSRSVEDYIPFLPGKGEYKRVDVPLYMNDIKNDKEREKQSQGIIWIHWEQKHVRGGGKNLPFPSALCLILYVFYRWIEV